MTNDFHNLNQSNSSNLGSDEEAALYLIPPQLAKPQVIIDLNLRSKEVNAERLYQEIFLVEQILQDENSNSLVVCIAIQNATNLFKTFISCSSHEELLEVGAALRRLKRISKRAVKYRDRKFFAGARSAIKSFDRFLEWVIDDGGLRVQLAQKLFELVRRPTRARRKIYPVQAAEIPTEIHDWRNIKSIEDLDLKLREVFPQINILRDQLGDFLQESNFRHYVQIAYQSTSKTKDGALLRETKLVKLLLDESLFSHKNHDLQPIEGMVEFNSHATRRHRADLE